MPAAMRQQAGFINVECVRRGHMTVRIDYHYCLPIDVAGSAGHAFQFPMIQNRGSVGGIAGLIVDAE